MCVCEGTCVSSRGKDKGTSMHTGEREHKGFLCQDLVRLFSFRSLSLGSLQADIKVEHISSHLAPLSRLSELI